MINEVDLPIGWVVGDLGDVCDILDAQRIPVNAEERKKRIAKKSEAELYPYYGATGEVGKIDDYIFDGQFVLLGEDAAPFFDSSKDTAYLAKGKFWVNNHAHIIKSSILHDSFLCFFLNQFNFEGYVSGTTRLKLPQGSMKQIPVKFPSINEQNRIVDKIEVLFSEVDAGIKNLTLAKRQLEQYRQSLLKHAFEGKLTAKWREDYAEKHGKSLPNANELLEQIQTVRKDYYDQQMADWEQAVKSWEDQGKEDTKPRKPSKLEDIKVINKTELSTILPSYWSEQYLESISIISGGLTKNASRKVLEEQVPYLRVANVHANELRLDDISYIGIKESEKPRTLLQENDLLIVEGNGSIEHIGRVALWTGEIHPCYHQNHLIKARIFEIVEPKYILYFLLSATGRERIVKVASSTTGLHTLSLSKVSNLIIPLTSLAEQKQIIELLESKLSDSERLIDDIDTQLKKANLLKTSILHKAFQGKLVPQDPNDPPASELLAQIQAEREAKALAEKQAKQNKAASKNKSKSAKAPKKSKKDEQITLPL